MKLAWRETVAVCHTDHLGRQALLVFGEWAENAGHPADTLADLDEELGDDARGWSRRRAGAGPTVKPSSAYCCRFKSRPRN